MSSYGSMVVPVVPEPTVLLPVDGYWLRLVVRDIPDDKVATDDAADFLDTLYDIDPCVEPEPEPPPPPTEGDILLAAQQVLFDAGECTRLKSGDYTAHVEVVRSHIQYPYKLRLSVGTIVQTVTETTKKEEGLDINNASSITLPYPIYPGNMIQASWLGAVFADDQRITPPPIRVVGSTLFWGFNATGTIKAHWNTTYDVVSVYVPGTANPAGGLGQQHGTTLTAFYIGPAVSERISPPERDAEMNHSLLDMICGYEPPQGFGGVTNEDDDGEDDVPVADRPGYECMEYAIGPLGSEAYYEQVCCEWPSVALMECAMWKVPKSSESLSEETQDFYRSYVGADYNDDGFLVTIESVDFVPVGPRPSDPDGCGYDIYTLQVRPLLCCEDVSPLYIDEDQSATIIADNSYGWVYVGGGRLPMEVTVDGLGFFLDAHKTFKRGTANSRVFPVYTADACGICEVTISDGCSSVVHTIKSTTGKWEVVWFQHMENYSISVAESYGAFTVPQLSVGVANGEISYAEYSADGRYLMRGYAGYPGPLNYGNQAYSRNIFRPLTAGGCMDGIRWQTPSPYPFNPIMFTSACAYYENPYYNWYGYKHNYLFLPIIIEEWKC